MRQTKSTRDSILTFIEAHGSTTTRELTDHLGITRQAINLHMRELISSGQVIKTGSTRASRYFPRSAAPVARVFSQQFELKGLQEFEVYERISITLNLKQLRPNVESIFHYAFTEILNNAIDHSKATRCHVDVRLEANSVGFEIRDGGIGVFYSIAEKHGLPDEQMAMIELIKGKTTTMPYP